MEIWTPLVFNGKILPNYFISNLGNMKNKKGLLVNSRLDKEKRYLVFSVYYNKKYYTLAVHKAVFRSFNKNIKVTKGFTVDHIDNNKLNNNLINLQYITHRENVSKDRVGKYHLPTGVTLSTDCNRKRKYMAVIRVNTKKKILGRFHTKTEARLAYLKELVSIGEFNYKKVV